MISDFYFTAIYILIPRKCPCKTPFKPQCPLPYLNQGVQVMPIALLLAPGFPDFPTALNSIPTFYMWSCPVMSFLVWNFHIGRYGISLFIFQLNLLQKFANLRKNMNQIEIISGKDQKKEYVM